MPRDSAIAESVWLTSADGSLPPVIAAIKSGARNFLPSKVTDRSSSDSASSGSDW
jgi:hypothetical protein